MLLEFGKTSFWSRAQRVVLIAMSGLLVGVVSGCSASPHGGKPLTQLLNLGPQLAGTKLLAPAGELPFTEVTGGLAVVEVKGAGVVRIRSLTVTTTPAQASARLKWSGLEPVAGTVESALAASQGLGPGPLDPAVAVHFVPVDSLLLRHGRYYDISVTIAVPRDFHQAWRIGELVIYYDYGGTAQRLAVRERIAVRES